jgi:hypothetical protein
LVPDQANKQNSDKGSIRKNKNPLHLMEGAKKLIPLTGKNKKHDNTPAKEPSLLVRH